MKKRLFAFTLIFAFAISGCNKGTPSNTSKTQPRTTTSISTSENSDVSASSSVQITSSSIQSTSKSSSSGGIKSSLIDPASPYFKKDLTVKMDAGLSEAKNKAPYDLSFRYDDELFIGNAKTYNKDLSLVSFAASIATATKERCNQFFNESGFKDITPHGYEEEPTKDSMGYFLAHKSIDDFELVAISFRGFNYGMEWANNFLVGKKDNHEGFNLRGLEAYQELTKYIANHAKDKTLKLWINGYSRAGALSNVLASLILKYQLVNVISENMFVYTFEAPASLSEENAVAYENVHNIINEVDLVAAIPPTTYGLKRCGVDHQIFDNNFAELLHQFDESINVPEFVTVTSTNEPLTTDLDVKNYALNSVFNKEEVETISEDVYANTREQYANNYQAGLSESLGYLFALGTDTLLSSIDDLKELGTGALTIVADQTGLELMNFLKPYLDKDHVEYDETSLQENCATLVKGIQNLFASVLLMYLSEEYKGNLTRLIDMHFPETTYVLLVNDFYR